MAGTVNKAIIIGHLGADPVVRATTGGLPIAEFRVATSRVWRDKATGERKEKTQWHKVATFVEGLSKVAEQYLKKGSKVYVEGEIEYQEYTDREGVKRWSTTIALRGFNSVLTMLDSQRGDRPPHAAENADDDSMSRPGPSNSGGGNDMDDDIPF